MIAYLINLGAASVEMDVIMQLDLIGMSLELYVLSHITSWNDCYQSQFCLACVCQPIELS